MQRHWILSFICLVIVLATSPTYAQKPIYGGTLTIAQAVEPPGFDPASNPSTAIPRVVYSNVLEGLVKIDRTGKIIPALAKEFRISKDGKEFTFSLERGVKFHDGKSFDADDVKFTFERLMDPKTAIIHPEYYKEIDTLQVVDPYTVKITLKTVSSMFLFNLARGDSVIVNRNAVDKLKAEPVGTGPFKFVEWARGDHITLAKFEGYYRKGIPYLDQVIFRFIGDPSAQIASLKAGDIDVIAYDVTPENASLLEKDPKFKVLNGYTTTKVILSTNNSKKPYYDDVRVRRAMAYAIDRNALIQGAMSGYGIPIGSHMDPGNPYYVDLTKTYPYNPQKAKQLLAEAGYPDGFEAVLKLPERYAYAKRSGEIIADMLSQVGIRLRIELTEWGQWIDRVFKNADFDLTVIGHAEPFDINIYANPNYYFRYNSPKFQETLKRAEMEADPMVRRELYITCQKIIADDAVNGFLYVMPSLPTMKKEVLGWWKDYPMTAVDVTEVWIQK